MCGVEIGRRGDQTAVRRDEPRSVIHNHGLSTCHGILTHQVINVAA